MTLILADRTIKMSQFNKPAGLLLPQGSSLPTSPALDTGRALEVLRKLPTGKACFALSSAAVPKSQRDGLFIERRSNRFFLFFGAASEILDQSERFLAAPKNKKKARAGRLSINRPSLTGLAPQAGKIGSLRRVL